MASKRQLSPDDPARNWDSRDEWRAEQRRWSRPEQEHHRVLADAEFWRAMAPSDSLQSLVLGVGAEPAGVEDPVGAYGRLRTLYIEQLKIKGHVPYDVKEALEQRDARLHDRLRRHRDSRQDQLLALREEVAYLRNQLPLDERIEIAVGAQPPPMLQFEEERHSLGRGPRDREVRLPGYDEKKKPVRPPGRPPATSKERVEKLAVRAARVLRLLSRSPDGLSQKALRGKLKMGVGQLLQALAELERAGSVEHDGNGNNSHWKRRVEVVRKTPRKSHPKE